MSDALRMAEIASRDLAARLRDLLPEAMRSTFDEDATDFEDDSGEIHVCGVFLAFGWSFRRLIADRDAPAIKAILAVIDELLEEFAPPPGVGPADGSVYNSILACFFENVLPVRSEELEIVVPFLGPKLRAHALEYDPWWLEPRPNARPSGS
jgi:hypothetical protein